MSAMLAHWRAVGGFRDCAPAGAVRTPVDRGVVHGPTRDPWTRDPSRWSWSDRSTGARV